MCEFSSGGANSRRETAEHPAANGSVDKKRKGSGEQQQPTTAEKTEELHAPTVKEGVADVEGGASSSTGGGGGWMSRIPSMYPWVQSYLPEISLHRMRKGQKVQPQLQVGMKEAIAACRDEEGPLRAQLLDLLHGASLPLESVSHAFAYGSGVIAQRGEDPSKKMVDFLIVCSDSLRFHQRNLLLNPSHYSLLPLPLPLPLPLRLHNASRLDRVQRFSGARLYYNTRIPTRGRLIKYGVIHVEDLETDLLDWTWLYAAGRLQKPVLEVFSRDKETTIDGQKVERDIDRAFFDNYRAATHAALLQLDGWFTMDQFLNKVVTISYAGDVRRYFGAEDPQKEEKLVAGASRQLRALYKPILAADRDVHIHADDRIEQDCSTPIVFFRLTQLPRTVLERLSKAYYPQRKTADTEELLYPISHRHDLSQNFSGVLQRIVYESSLRQSVKNFWTAGLTQSIRYIIPNSSVACLISLHRDYSKGHRFLKNWYLMEKETTTTQRESATLTAQKRTTIRQNSKGRKENPIGAKTSVDKQHKCEYCPKTFDWPSKLELHTRYHTDERPFKCDICKKRFHTSSCLKRHTFIHSSVRTFKCDICKKGFHQLDGLKVHSLVHSGVRSFKCDICNKRFKRSGHMKRHSLIHSGAQPFKKYTKVVIVRHETVAIVCRETMFLRAKN
uniref:Phosphatidate cytidylyltransferase, mitochondrial n=1 Tax=Globodera rostochiensis TaxID=31243 RepID=A0A914H9S0_GLORO